MKSWVIMHGSQHNHDLMIEKDQMLYGWMQGMLLLKVLTD